MVFAYNNSNQQHMNQPKAKVIAVTSGKGGVGKSSISTNLALSLAALDNKVCLFDADASLANINILLGIRPKFTLEHLFTGKKVLKDIIIDGPRGLKVIPGATGITEYAHFSKQQKEILLSTLDQLQKTFDYLIIDTAAGIGDDVLDFIRASQFSIVVITPEPTSLTDSFSLLKALKRTSFSKKTSVLVNMALDQAQSQQVYKRFKTAVEKYIEADIAYLGYVQVDETMISSVSLQCPAVLLNPESTASVCFKEIALSIEKTSKKEKTESFSNFWRQQDSVTTEKLTSINEVVPQPFIRVGEENPTVKPASPSRSFKEASNFCFDQLSKGQLSAEEMDDFASAFKQFQAQNQIQSNDSIKTEEKSEHAISDLYHQLEQESFPKEKIRDIVTTLEQVYLEKHHQSLHTVESATLKLFAQFTGTRSELFYMHKTLKERFERLFDKPLYNAFDEALTLAKSSSHSQEEVNSIIASFMLAYRERFSEEYKTKAHHDLKMANTVIKDLSEENKDVAKKLMDSEASLEGTAQILNKIQQLLPKLDKPVKD